SLGARSRHRPPLRGLVARVRLVAGEAHQDDGGICDTDGHSDEAGVEGRDSSRSGQRFKCSWPLSLRMSTNSLTVHAIGATGCSSTLRASYNSVTCGTKFVFARRRNPL